MIVNAYLLAPDDTQFYIFYSENIFLLIFLKYEDGYFNLVKYKTYWNDNHLANKKLLCYIYRCRYIIILLHQLMFVKM